MAASPRTRHVSKVTTPPRDAQSRGIRQLLALAVSLSLALATVAAAQHPCVGTEVATTTGETPHDGCDGPPAPARSPDNGQSCHLLALCGSAVVLTARVVSKRVTTAHDIPRSLDDLRRTTPAAAPDSPPPRV